MIKEYILKPRTLVPILFVVAISLFCNQLTKSVSAASTAGWNPGRIVDNVVFYDATSMSQDDIQVFLNTRMPNCDTWGIKPSEYGGGTRAQYGASKGYPAPFVCLRDYYENPTTRENNLHGSPIPAGARSGAQIIWDVSRQFGISPRVMLVMLQKESDRLLIDDWPWSSQYKTAMGYGCPDTGPNMSANCSSQYFGFYNQMYNAARQFALYSNNPQSYRYKSGQINTIQYNPDPACGSSSVYIENQATANLYNYTPYQPNQATLNAGYGTASCGAYGNRNFRLFYNDWFGSTYGNDTLTPHPDGTLVSMDGIIFLNDSSSRRRIMNADIFNSYDFHWNSVKNATTGDRQLPLGPPLDIIKPGKLFVGDSSGVYTMVWESNAWRKQLISYYSFTGLGYSWGDVQPVPANLVASIPTSSSVYNSLQHPSGTLIIQNGVVYLVDTGTRRPVGPYVYNSYGWPWSSVENATIPDTNLPEGVRYLFKEGTLLFDGSGLYVVDVPPSGYEIKLPIGPWECFTDTFKYTLQESITLPQNWLPVATGARVTCN